MAAVLALARPAGAAEPTPPPLGSSAFLDYKNGLRDARFGTPPAAIEGLGPLRADGDLQCGARSTEKLEFGSARLSAIDYCFMNGRLARIDVTFASVVDTELGLEGLTTSWGNPLSMVRVPDPDVARRIKWIGKRVRAVLETREHVGKGGRLTLMSTEYVAYDKGREAQREKQRQERFGKDL